MPFSGQFSLILPQANVPPQLLEARNAATYLHQGIVLKALLARATPELDINLWDHAVRETHEETGEKGREPNKG